MSLEIHLPQIVGSRMLEPLNVRLPRAIAFIELTMTTQNLRDCTRRRNLDDLQIKQPPTQLSTTPRRMLTTQRQHSLFYLISRPPRWFPSLPSKPRSEMATLSDHGNIHFVGNNHFIHQLGP